MSRILVQAPRLTCDAAVAELADDGHHVVACESCEALFSALAERRPDVLVYVLQELGIDVAVLSYLRRLAPTLPMILLGSSTGLAERRSIQDLKPTYYGMMPLEPMELSEVVRGALSRVAGRG